MPINPTSSVGKVGRPCWIECTVEPPISGHQGKI